MKSSATLMVISGNKMMTKFMQCGDVFEKSKVLGNVKYITANYNKGEKITLRRAEVLIDATKKALESEEIVSFVHLLEVTNGNITTKNQGEIAPYINKGVRCISNGSNWFVLAKFIEQTVGLKVITDEHMFIMGVGIEDDIKGVKFNVDKNNICISG